MKFGQTVDLDAQFAVTSLVSCLQKRERPVPYSARVNVGIMYTRIRYRVPVLDRLALNGCGNILPMF